MKQKRKKSKKNPIPPSKEWFGIKGPKRERLVTERKKMKLKQSELAKMVGVSPAYISCLENGRCDPGLEVSIELQELFQLPDHILFPD